MADTYTQFLNLTKPEVGASRDTWGDKYNANFQALDTWAKTTDAALKATVAVANAAVKRAGDQMAGVLSLFMGDAALELTQNGGAFDKKTWRLMNYNQDGNLYFQDYANGAFVGNPVYFKRDGSIVSAKYGDIGQAIANAQTAAQNATNTKVAKAGDTMTGALVGPQFTVDGAGGQLVWNSRNAKSAFLLYNTDDYFRFWNAGDIVRVGKVGDIWTNQIGDLKTYIDAARDAAGNTGINAANQKLPLTGGALSGNLTIGNGQANSYLFMADSDDGQRAVHNNTGTIGFLGTDNNWILRSDDNGGLWTKQLGDINTRIETRAKAFADIAQNAATAVANTKLPLTGGALTGDTYVSKAYPTLGMNYPNVMYSGWQVRENGYTYLMNLSTGGGLLWIGPGGEVSTAQLGDLNTRIETRASDFANTVGNGRVHSARFVYAGDLNMNWSPGNMNSPYGGYACVVDRWTYSPWSNELYIDYAKRFRYLQLITNNAGWFTVGAAS